MTTIAYDGKAIAFDSRITCCDMIHHDEAVKVYQSDAGLMVLCGNWDESYRFASEFLADDDAPEEVEDISGFCVDGSGSVFRVFVAEDKFRLRPARRSWADGSGMCWAIAAMDHGKSAAEAVRYAATRDTNTGGVIRQLNLKTLKVEAVKPSSRARSAPKRAV